MSTKQRVNELLDKLLYAHNEHKFAERMLDHTPSWMENESQWLYAHNRERQKYAVVMNVREMVVDELVRLWLETRRSPFGVLE